MGSKTVRGPNESPPPPIQYEETRSVTTVADRITALLNDHEAIAAKILKSFEFFAFDEYRFDQTFIPPKGISVSCLESVIEKIKSQGLEVSFENYSLRVRYVKKVTASGN